MAEENSQLKAREPIHPKDATVLIVEDNVSNFVLMARMLAYMGVPRCEWKTSGWQVVEFAGRLFPGEMPGSFAKDFDDFEARAPERVFADPAAALDGLIENCRSLLFGNPVASREILSVIKGFSARQR